MPQFILNHGGSEASERFAMLDTFTQGYVEAIFWCGLPDDEENTPAEGYSLDDFSDAAWKTAGEDCFEFQIVAGDEIADRLHQAGVDFWLTRNRHGAGFWDRDGYADHGARLTDLAHGYGSQDVYIGDDSKIYLS